MARRVNKRFLIILTSVFAALAIGAVVMMKVAQRGNAPEWVKKAEASVAKGEYRDAKEYYARALRIEPNNVEYTVAIGDMSHQLAREDKDEINQDRRAWERALEVDPRYVPALKRLLDRQVDVVELQPNPQAFTEVAERGRALAQAEPENVKAKAWAEIGVVGAWLAGGTASGETIDKSVEALVALMPQAPEMVEIPYYAAETLMRQARQKESANDVEGAKPLRERAAGVYDAALKASPEDPRLLYRYGLFVVQSREQGEAALAKAVEKSKEVTGRAAALVKPDNKEYDVIKMRWAQVLHQDGKRGEAEKVLNEVLEKQPYNTRARILLAAMIKSDRAEEALKLLEQPVGDDPRHVGVRAHLRRLLEMDREVELTGLRIDMLARRYDGLDAGQRRELRGKIDEGIGQVSSRWPADHPVVAKLKARALLLDGDVSSRREASRVLQKAIESPDNARGVDGELVYMLAKAYRSLGETGQARDWFARLVAQRPTYVPARKDLAFLLADLQRLDVAASELTDRERADRAELEKHLAELEKQAPEDEEVKRLRLVVAAAGGRKEQALTLARAMGEETEQGKLAKATALIMAGDGASAEGLLAPMVEKERAGSASASGPAFPAMQLLTQYYLKEGKKEQAKPLIEAARAKAPNDLIWKRLSLALSEKVSPEELRALRESAVAAMTDPAERALSQSTLLLEQDKVAEAEKVLVEAEKVAAGDQQAGRLREALFNYGVAFKKWEVAEAYLAKLTEMDWDQAEGLYYRTRLSHERREVDAALRQAQELTRRVPEFARHWLLLAQVQQAAGLHEAAAGSYTQVLNRQSNNLEALRGMVECQLMMRQVDVARKYIEQGLRLSANDPFLREVSKRVEEMFGDPSKVTAVREKDAAANTESSAVAMALVENYLRVNDKQQGAGDKAGAAAALAKAKEKLDAALAKWPDELSLYRRLSDWSVRAGKMAEAVGPLEKLSQREQWKERVEPLMLLVDHYKRMGSEGRVKAELTLQQALDRSKDEKEKTGLQGRLAFFHLENKEYDKAIGLLAGVYERTKDATVQRQLVDAYLAAGRPLEADKLLGEALAQSPDDARLLAQRAAIRVQQKDFAGALPLVEQAVRANAQYAGGYYYRGMARLGLGEVNEAIVDLERARDMSPSVAELRMGLAEAYQRRNQPELAVKELETAQQLAPGRSDVRLKLLEQYFAQRRWSDAEILINSAKADENLGLNPVWWQREKRMWVERGSPERGLPAIRRAMELAPDNPEVLKDYLDLLVLGKQWEQVVQLTTPLLAVPANQRPWWVHAMRAEGLKNLGDKEGMARELGLAMSVTDAASDEAAADPVAIAMAQSLGVKATAAALRPRKEPRWQLALLPILVSAQDLPQAVEVTNEVMNQSFGQLSQGLQLVALRQAALVYTHAALAGMPGMSEQADKVYERYLSATEQSNVKLHIEALNNVATLLAEHPTNPNPERALGYARKAFDLVSAANRFEPGVVDTYGWVLVLAGQVDPGIEQLLRVVNSDQPLPDSFYHLGEAYLRKNEAEDALRYLTKAKAMLAAYKQQGALVDPTLEGKIEAAIGRAKAGAKAPAVSSGGN